MTDYLSVMLPASLPPDNYELLKTIFLHFHKVVQRKDVNKMVTTLTRIRFLKTHANATSQNEANMATVWGPNLIASSDPMSMQSSTLPEVIKNLIKNAPTIFAVLISYLGCGVGDVSSYRCFYSVRTWRERGTHMKRKQDTPCNHAVPQNSNCEQAIHSTFGELSLPNGFMPRTTVPFLLPLRESMYARIANHTSVSAGMVGLVPLNYIVL